jgi:hypothetical protein
LEAFTDLGNSDCYVRHGFLFFGSQCAARNPATLTKNTEKVWHTAAIRPVTTRN